MYLQDSKTVWNYYLLTSEFLWWTKCWISDSFLLLESTLCISSGDSVIIRFVIHESIKAIRPVSIWTLQSFSSLTSLAPRPLQWQHVDLWLGPWGLPPKFPKSSVRWRDRNLKKQKVCWRITHFISIYKFKIVDLAIDYIWIILIL